MPLTLHELIWPLSKSRFVERYWEQRSLTIRNVRRVTAAFPDLRRLDALMTSCGLRYPAIRLVSSTRTIDPVEYTTDLPSKDGAFSATIDPIRAARLFELGATIVFQNVDRHDRGTSAFCRQLESEFFATVGCNIYVTPPRSRGLSAHWDPHDVFAVQLVGEKTWSLFGSPEALPLPETIRSATRLRRSAPKRRIKLRVADALYLPRGFVHSAESGQEISVHATLGVHTVTWTNFLEALVRHAAEHEVEIRKSIPMTALHTDRKRFDSAFRVVLDRLQARMSPEVIIQHLRKGTVARSRPIASGVLLDVARMSHIDAGSRVFRRLQTAFAIRATRTFVELTLPGNSLVLPVDVAPALVFVLRHTAFRVRDLPGLTPASRLRLTRALVREGLLSLVRPDHG